MNVAELLDAAKKAQGFETDMALAKALGISRSAVSAWRSGTKGPDPVQSAALAGYTGIPLAKVLGIVGEARAISAKEKDVWRRLAATATLLAAGVIGGALQPAQAATLGVEAAPTVHYAKYNVEPSTPAGRCWPCFGACYAVLAARSHRWSHAWI